MISKSQRRVRRVLARLTETEAREVQRLAKRFRTTQSEVVRIALVSLSHAVFRDSNLNWRST